MKVDLEKQENNQAVLTVEVDEERVAAALDTAFRKIRKQINVPGFRKGRVPRKLFEARFGIEALYQDAVDELLPESYGKALDESGIQPVDQPEIDVKQIENGKPFIFKATVTVMPEVTLGQYKELEIPDKDFTVKDEDVEAEIDAMRNRYAELEVVDGAAEEKDFVLIDFEGSVDGEAFEGGKAENHQLELGSGQFIPGFEDQLIGLKAGDEKDVVVTFPEDYHQESLAGKEATFKVKVNEVKRKHLPELDDEFAKDVSEFDTLEELKADTRKKLQERKQQEEEQYKKDTVAEKATENAEVDIPDVMIEREVDRMIQNLEQQLSMQGMTLEMYKQTMGDDADDLRESFREEAEKRVKTSLVLDAIAEEEKIEVTEEDVDEEVERLAELYNRPVDEIRKIFAGEANIESLKGEIKIRKTLEHLVSNSRNAA